MFQGALFPSMLGTSGIIRGLIFKKQKLFLLFCHMRRRISGECFLLLFWGDKSASGFPLVIDMRPENLSSISVHTFEVLNFKVLRNRHVGPCLRNI